MVFKEILPIAMKDTNVLHMLFVFKYWCSLNLNIKTVLYIFFLFLTTCIPEKVNAYHTGSAFTYRHIDAVG